ncbi:hypothetical protein ACFLSJ_07235 [Verrucomicrobiota bacterium]
MTANSVSLESKPDFAEAARHWDAFWQGEIIDRPVVQVIAGRGGPEPPTIRRYQDWVFADIDDLLDRTLAQAAATYYGGDAIPCFNPSMGPDEIACFCGGELCWSDEAPETNWSRPFVSDWREALPLAVQQDNPLWQRTLRLLDRAAERLADKMLIGSLDLHTNMDLLAAVRGPQQLCLDLLDQPDVIDEAMASTMSVFRTVWHEIARARRMADHGHCRVHYDPSGAATLQCDFCCMISPPMFRRWVLPYLEEEARIVGRAAYHWDGPDALIHEPDLAASKGLYAFGYVPGAGHGGHIDYLDLYKRMQAAGKAVLFHGSQDECKAAHRELRPDLTVYTTRANTPAQAEELLRWFVRNT